MEQLELKFRCRVFPLLITAAWLSCANAQTTPDVGAVTIRFLYGGPSFEPAPVNVAQDGEFCGKHPLVNERLLVDPKTKGIKNVLVYVDTGRGQTKLPAANYEPETVELANDKCRFEPRIVITKVGDTLKVTNPDTVAHNANIDFWENRPVNLTIPAGGHQEIKLTDVEGKPAVVACNIHPWMAARVMVLDNPYAAVSNDQGEVTIKGLPAGQLIVFRVFHEAGNLKEVDVNGEDEEWKNGRFEVKIDPGFNDLGTVTVPADALSAD